MGLAEEIPWRDGGNINPKGKPGDFFPVDFVVP